MILRKHALLLLLLFGLNGILLAQTPVKESKGFYQFTTDDPNQKYFVSDRKGVMGQNGMIASAHPVSSQVGTDILKKGGNAVDAAIATMFALAVVHPAAGNVGGGGFMVYRAADGKSYSLDFREKAPLKASRDMYLDAQKNVIDGLSLEGHLASGVPGSVDGMAMAHARFGKLPWADLLQPAIDLAAKGVVQTEREARSLNYVKQGIQKVNPGTAYYLRADGRAWQAGDTLVNRDLAKVLVRIQKKGRNGFYKGKVARLLAREMKRNQGIITKRDLKEYHATWREPIVGDYKEYKLITMPPSSSGGVALMQLLRLSEPYPLRRWGWNTDSTTQVMIEAERRVYADRAKFLGDSDFMKVPIDQLISYDYLKKRWQGFSFDHATDSKDVDGGDLPGYESLETTHFSVVDKDRNAVAITTTINGSFGSKVLVKGGGFFMNNEMDDFSAKAGVPNMFGLIGGKANEIQPGKRMLSAMTPTIIEKQGQLYMVAGTPGGSTIITSVYQTILNVIEHGMTMQQSVNALKFHHQWLPDKTVFEAGAFTENTVEKLRSRGYTMEQQSNTIGRMDCILVLPGGMLEGASDPRSDNTSMGY